MKHSRRKSLLRNPRFAIDTSEIVLLGAAAGTEFGL